MESQNEDDKIVQKNKRGPKIKPKKDDINLRISKIKKSGKITEKSHSCKDFRKTYNIRRRTERSKNVPTHLETVKKLLSTNRRIKKTQSDNIITKNLKAPVASTPVVNKKDKVHTVRDDHLNSLNSELANQNNSRNYYLNRNLLSKKEYNTMSEEDIKFEIMNKAEYSGLFVFDENLKNCFRTNNPFNTGNLNSEKTSVDECFDHDALRLGMESCSSINEGKKHKGKETGRSIAANRLKRNYGFRS